MKSKIEWTDKTWNPVTGCTKYSSGCVNCYAEVMAKRLNAMGIEKYKNAFSLTLHEECLEEPLCWKGNHNIFVCSMSDLFHEKIPFEFIDKVINTIEKTKNNRYQILTKRAERMAEYFSSRPIPKNVWLGVTVEEDSTKYRIDYLRELKATVKFLSCEPLIADLGDINLTNIDWIIVGGESGPKARPMKAEWVINIKEQAEKSNVVFFFKQWGTWGCDGIKRSKKRNGKLLNGKIAQERPIFSQESRIDFMYNSLKIIGFKNIYGNLSLVFEISLKNQKSAFMRIDMGYMDKDNYILVLDVNKIRKSIEFSNLLDDNSIFMEPQRQPDYIKRKAIECINGFAKGITNPVPIADISYCNGVKFIDGITRTSYLAEFSESSIPIKCNKYSVEKLFDLYGDKNYIPKSISDYFYEYKKKKEKKL